MGNTALIRAEKGHVGLEIAGYENPDANDRDDANWLAGILEVKAGPFCGSFPLALTTLELEDLRAQFTKATTSLVDEVDFATMEETFSIKVKFSRAGQASLWGVAAPKGGNENYLRYSFTSDPITLEAVTRELALLAALFPVKQFR
jgi:hypothetical protein